MFCTRCSIIPAPAPDFHDMTGFHQVSNNNGFYPVTRGYDEATGIGTPNFTGVITG